jgi:hypothetical protein
LPTNISFSIKGISDNELGTGGNALQGSDNYMKLQPALEFLQVGYELCILEKYGVMGGLDSCGSTKEPVADFCGHGNEPSGFHKWFTFPERLCSMGTVRHYPNKKITYLF